jgi:hypothetical protein
MLARLCVISWNVLGYVINVYIILAKMPCMNISLNTASVLERAIWVEKSVSLHSSTSSKSCIWVFKGALLCSLINYRERKRLGITRVSSSWYNATIWVIVWPCTKIIVVAITLRLLLIRSVAVLSTFKYSWRDRKRSSLPRLKLWKSQTNFWKFHCILFEAVEVCWCSNWNVIPIYPSTVLVVSRFNRRFETIYLWDSIRLQCDILI